MNTPAQGPGRPIGEMVERLRLQLKLLKAHADQAFLARDTAYFQEVATKLRLLLIDKGRSNTPLLLEVAAKYDVNLTVEVLPGPIHRDDAPSGTHPFAAVLDHVAYRYNDNGNIRAKTNKDLILAWAENLGGAHEDWKHPEWLTRARRRDFEINGLDPMELLLGKWAEITLSKGNELLTHIGKICEPGDAN